MKILFLCNTPYQLLFAINFVYKKNVQADVIITNTIANQEKCFEDIAKSNVFSKVLMINIEQISNGDSNIKQFVNGILRKKIKFEEITDCKYDQFYFANFNPGLSYLWRSLKKSNKDIETIMYEDGFSTYSPFYGKIINKIINPSNLIRRIFNPLVYEIFYNINGVCCYNPQLLEWSCKYKLLKAPSIDVKDSNFINLVNLAFGIKTIEEGYNKKYIFFEESYCADNIDVGDIEIVNKLAEIIGKDNIFIKIHPRNKVNRFKKLGYETNENTSVPWEVIALNCNLADKILLTIASVSVLTPNVIMGLDSRGFMFFPAVKDQSLLRQDIIPTYKHMSKLSNGKISITNDVNLCMKKEF